MSQGEGGDGTLILASNESLDKQSHFF